MMRGAREKEIMFKNQISRIIACKINIITLSDHAEITMKFNLNLELGHTLWGLKLDPLLKIV